jgi:hypothetical protein
VGLRGHAYRSAHDKTADLVVRAVRVHQALLGENAPKVAILVYDR